MMGGEELTAVCFREAVFDESKVEVFVGTVEFVSDDRMAQVGEVDADLVLAAGMRDQQEFGKEVILGACPGARARTNLRFRLRLRLSRVAGPDRPGESAHDLKIGAGSGPVGPDTVFDRDPALFILPERGFDSAGIEGEVAVNNSQVLLVHVPMLPSAAQGACRFGRFGYQDQTAGFAVEPIHHLRCGRLPQVQPDAADQTGVGVRLGGMAHQSRRFVHDQQLAILKNNVE